MNTFTGKTFLQRKRMWNCLLNSPSWASTSNPTGAFYIIASAPLPWKLDSWMMSGDWILIFLILYNVQLLKPTACLSILFYDEASPFLTRLLVPIGLKFNRICRLKRLKFWFSENVEILPSLLLEVDRITTETSCPNYEAIMNGSDTFPLCDKSIEITSRCFFLLSSVVNDFPFLICKMKTVGRNSTIACLKFMK